MKIQSFNEYRIIVCSFTPFHMYGIASHLNNTDNLKLLITNYPKHKIKEYKIDKDKIVTFTSTGVILNILRKLPIYQINFFRRIFIKILCLNFCKSVKNYLKNLNEKNIIFWGMSGFCLEPILEIEKRNGISIVDFGSLNLEYQEKLNFLYSKHLGYKPQKINQWIIDRQKKEFDNANIVVVTSNVSKKSFEKVGLDTNKILVKHPTPDLKYFKLDKSIKKNLTFTFLFVGGLSFNKGIEFLCDAFVSEFLFKEATLKIIGGKVEWKYYSYLKKKYSGYNIVFLGTRKKQRLAEYYNKADCTVLPSLADGFGKTVLESLSCGTPAICSKNVGARDILPKRLSKLSWEPLDIKCIKNSLRNMYDNRTFNIKNRCNLANKFNYQNYTKKLKSEDEQIFSKISEITKNRT